MKYVILLLFLGVAAHGQQLANQTPSFARADRIAATLDHRTLKNLPVLAHDLTAPLDTETEKFRAIYTWVCTNIKNDYYAFLKTKDKRKKIKRNPEAFRSWNDAFTPKMFKKLIREQKTACSGYAYLIRELAQLAGIESVIVNGYGRTVNTDLKPGSPANHAWNAVKLDGQWHLCDATWSAGSIVFDKHGPKFHPDYQDGYFLAAPELFAKNHFPLDAQWMLLQNPTSFEEFIEGPLVYKGAYKLGLAPMSPQKMRFRVFTHERVPFEFLAKNKLAPKALTLRIDNGIKTKEVSTSFGFQKNTLSFGHTFVKMGTYDLHVEIDGVPVATYVIKVKKKSQEAVALH